jgi:hypothetical protein
LGSPEGVPLKRFSPVAPSTPTNLVKNWVMADIVQDFLAFLSTVYIYKLLI